MENEDEGINSEVKFADGSINMVDLSDLFERADLLASIYGLGACKTLTEFVRMVDKEDPFVINGLIKAAVERVNIQNGAKPSRKNVEYSNSTSSSTNKNKFATSKDSLVSFLKQMGAGKQEIDEAMVKIKSGQIKTSGNDYSYITPEVLWDPNFDFKGTLKKMSEDRKKSVNIRVSDQTMRQRKTNG